jgi:hypothetical protein
MDIIEAYGKSVNLAIHKNINESLKFLKLTPKIIEENLKKKKIKGKSFDIVLDFKPRINQLYIYLSSLKKSGKLEKSLNPDSLEFKSMIIYLGDILLFGKRIQVRLGAFGCSCSDLARAVIEYKKKI